MPPSEPSVPDFTLPVKFGTTDMVLVRGRPFALIRSLMKPDSLKSSFLVARRIDTARERYAVCLSHESPSASGRRKFLDILTDQRLWRRRSAPL